ncbi:hypothetical protein [Mangrovicoccus sp. HB161399]|uniref:hypothetical protein n=1 Tax=Mangrovicoccus sp. HB161399 TaxID=2720392 RepID=UPI00155804AF|nr:hypothetical protein [Mangrovicoccus sp. HB161399]
MDLEYVNAQLAAHATCGPLVCDLYTALATEDLGSGDLTVPAASQSDDIHLNGTGCATVAATIDAKATALGWTE